MADGILTVVADRFYRWVAKEPHMYPPMKQGRKTMVDWCCYKIWIDGICDTGVPLALWTYEGIHVPMDDLAIITNIQLEATQMCHTGEVLMSWLSVALYSKYAGYLGHALDVPVINGTIGEIHWSNNQRNYPGLYIPLSDEDELYIQAHLNPSTVVHKGPAEFGVEAVIYLSKET